MGSFGRSLLIYLSNIFTVVRCFNRVKVPSNKDSL